MGCIPRSRYCGSAAAWLSTTTASPTARPADSSSSTFRPTRTGGAASTSGRGSPIRPPRRRRKRTRAAFGGADLRADGSVAAELESWLNERELDAQETTLSNYRDIMRCYVVPHIGTRQLYALDNRAIHELYKKLLKSGGKNGGPLSSTTVRIVHRVMMKALSDLGVNVDGVRQPRQVERETMGRKGVWTPAPSAKFLKYHAVHRLRAAWVLAIVVGPRRAELAGPSGRVWISTGVCCCCTDSAPRPATAWSRSHPRARASGR
ncbi:hypothetical protein [Micromonospora sp. NPDC049274]|uniref:hypothetical protein n=1 Tax=Micromonospora sp. NPDC049274 TaxID=3154829 RepID=UPI003446554A